MLDRYITKRDATAGSLKTKELSQQRHRIIVRFQGEVFGSGHGRISLRGHHG
jgi:hypothetical protein